MQKRATPTQEPLSSLWSDVDVAGAFAATYVEARGKFLAAAQRRGLPVESFEHPSARGPGGEALFVDVAVLGDTTASQALILTSGTHGVEGFCGSGCQVALLADDVFAAYVTRRRAAVVFVHAINPWGFAHVARTTEDNVDLNRNFLDFGALARNDAYLEVHEAVVPSMWPPSAEQEARLAEYVATRGAGALQAAVSAGQSDRPDGLFYAGRKATWSQQTLRAILRRHGAARERLAWIDFHTGLGPSGHGEKIFAGPNDATMLARARAWWGCDVTSMYDGSSTSARLSGLIYQAALDECPQASYAGIALEFGTLPLPQVMRALRARAWLINQKDADVPQRGELLGMVRDAFYVDTLSWKAMVAGQARVAALQALAGLGGQCR